MTESQQIREIIAQASQILSKCKVNKDMQNYLNYQLLSCQNRPIFFPCCNRYSGLKQQISSQFQSSYQSLSKIEKAQFYLLNAKNIMRCQNSETLKKKESFVDLMLQNKQFEKMRFSIRDNKTFKKKTLVTASISKKQKQLKIDFNNEKIDLHKFLIRKSKNKKHKFCIVFQPIQPYISSSSIHLYFNELDYKNSYPFIRKLWQDSQFENVSILLQNKENRKIDSRRQNDKINQIRASDQLTNLNRRKIIKRESIDTHQFENSQLEQIEESLQFFTVTGSLQSEGVDKQFKVQVNEKDFTSLKDELTERQNKLQFNYLKHFYQLYPKTKGIAKLFKEPEGHIIFGKDWRICDNGYFVFANQHKIKIQNGVFKSVVKRIGANIMSGKGLSNILNISFPVEVFCNYSNLQKMAKAYIYAPIFIQRAAKTKDPVERMKNVICFSLGTTVAYVQSQKPFNPILGQTYQGIIDGCPVYAEQISHHPPICSILFLGRGYKIYGSFEPKFQIGLNSATGRNDGVHNIEFQSDQSLIKCSNPAGQMHGLAIGERRLFHTRKTAYIDSKNRIFCQIVWGRQKSDPYPQAKLYDYFRGRIVKIKQGVNIEDFNNIKKTDIQEQYGDVYGRFTGEIFFNDKLIFDTGRDQPFLLQDYVPCLQSDSRHRKDIIQLRKNDLEGAQTAKEELEQIQRNDRKLRKQFHNKRK